MNNSKKMTSAAILVASVLATMPAYAVEQSLSGEELQAMVTDVDIEFSGRGLSGVTNYRLDGTATTKLTIGLSDHGNWWLDGDQVCTRWQRFRSGEASCFTVHPSEGNTYQTSSGFTIRAL
jgi:hypothetical protein